MRGDVSLRGHETPMRETSAPMVEYASPVSEIEASHGTPYPGGGGGAPGVAVPSHRDAWIFPNPVAMDDVREGTVPADASRRARAHRAQHAEVSEGRSARPSRRGIRRPARFRESDPDTPDPRAAGSGATDEWRGIRDNIPAFLPFSVATEDAVADAARRSALVCAPEGGGVCVRRRLVRVSPDHCLSERVTSGRARRTLGRTRRFSRRAIDRPLVRFTLSATSDARSAGPAALAHSLGLRTS